MIIALICIANAVLLAALLWGIFDDEHRRTRAGDEEYAKFVYRATMTRRSRPR